MHRTTGPAWSGLVVPGRHNGYNSSDVTSNARVLTGQGAAQQRVPQPAATTLTDRVDAIDLARALAILMMLQSHFVNVALVPSARSLDNPAYLAYARLRNLTAPFFLTVSGLVFIYFLSAGADDEGAWKRRIEKGLRRAALLIGLGHGLQLIPRTFAVSVEAGIQTLMRVHVLQVVGVGLVVLCSAHALQRWLRVPLTPLALALALGSFVASPGVSTLDLRAAPPLLRNYLQTDYGSVFTLFPWLGYMCLGGACGSLIARVRGRPRRSLALAIGLCALGVLCARLATPVVFALHRSCDAVRFACDLLPATHVYLARAGTCLALLALLLAFEPLVRRHAPRWLLETGRHTLLIYIVHAVILYGTITGMGLDRAIRQQLSPQQAALAAAAFVIFHVLGVQAWTRAGPLRARPFADPPAAAMR